MREFVGNCETLTNLFKYFAFEMYERMRSLVSNMFPRTEQKHDICANAEIVYAWWRSIMFKKRKTQVRFVQLCQMYRPIKAGHRVRYAVFINSRIFFDFLKVLIYSSVVVDWSIQKEEFLIHSSPKEPKPSAALILQVFHV